VSAKKSSETLFMPRGTTSITPAPDQIISPVLTCGLIKRSHHQHILLVKESENKALNIELDAVVSE
jgi:hypothetical protein